MPQLLNDNNIVYVGFDGLVPVETAADENLVYAIKDSNEKLMFGIDDQGYAYFNKEDEQPQIIHVFSDTDTMKNTAYPFDFALVLNDNAEDGVMQLYQISNTATPDSIALNNDAKYAVPIFKTLVPHLSYKNEDDVYLINDSNGKIVLAIDEQGEVLFEQSLSEDNHVVKSFDTLDDARYSAYLYQYVIVTADDYTNGIYKVTDESTNISLPNGKYLKMVIALNCNFSYTTEQNDSTYAIKDKNGKIVFAIDSIGNRVVTEEFGDDKYVVRMFDTVADMRNSSYPFDYAITAGFHSPNDGGGAMYRVTTGLTANGMDIHQIYGTNRVCQIIKSTTMYVDQFGAQKNVEGQNLAPIMQRMVYIGVMDLRFHTGIYWTSTVVIPTTHSLHISGHDAWPAIPPNTTDPAKATSIYFRSTRTDEGASCFSFEYRHVCIENMAIVNRPNPGDPGRIGLYCYQTDGLPQLGHYGYIFRRLLIQGFDRGIQLFGKVVWDCTFDDVRVSSCNYGLWFGGEGNMLCSFRLFYTDHCKEVGIYIGCTTLCASFWNCNFGTYGKVIEWYKVHDEDLPRDTVSASFYDCNFETDQAQDGLDGFCVRTADWYRAILTFIGCEFSFRKMPDMPNSKAFSLGHHTSVVFQNCKAFDVDNEIGRANFFADRPCLQKTGSIMFIGQNEKVPRPNFSNGFEGCVLDIGVDGPGIPKFDTLSNVENIGVPVGQQFYVIDEDALYIKKQNGVQKIG